MLNVQKYLENHTLKELKDEFDISITLYEDRVVLNYGIKSPRFHPICDECRGLILSFPDYNVMCRSFDRFYNYMEGDTGRDVDFSKINVVNKEDGSLINVYFDGNKWCVATRKMAFAEGTTSLGTSYHDLFEKTLGVNIQYFADVCFLPEYTYIFELCTPENRVVKDYGKSIIFLIGIRNNNYGFYVLPEAFDNWSDLFKFVGANINFPKIYNFNSIDNIMESLKDLPTLDEGYVCVDDSGTPIMKIKSPSYVAVHKIRDNGVLVPKRIVSLIHMGEHHEYLSYFETDKVYFDPYVKAYDAFIEDIYNIWNSVKHIENQKEFALKVKDLPISGIIFGLKKGLTVDEMLDKTSDVKLSELVEKYKE